MYIVFSSNTCPYCTKAVQYIHNNTDEACTVVNVTEQVKLKLQKVVFTLDPAKKNIGLTVPQIFRINESEMQYNEELEFLEYARFREDEDEEISVEYIGGYENIVRYLPR